MNLIHVFTMLAAMTLGADAPAGNMAFGLPEDKTVPVADSGAMAAIEPVQKIEAGGVSVAVSAQGAVRIDVGGDVYLVESCFTYPGKRDGKPMIGWNGLPAAFKQDNYPDVTQQLGNERSWRPRIKRGGDGVIIIEAAGAAYHLRRTARLEDGRVDITDTFRNRRDKPTGITPRYRVTANEDYLARYSPGLEVSANPTIFLAGRNSRVGLVMQDSISRRRIRPWVPESGNRAGFQINRVVAEPGKTRTFEWSVYVMGRDAGYFDMINRVRRDWNSNFTIDGPFAFLYLRDENGKFEFETSSLSWNIDEVMRDPGPLREYLQWKPAKIVALMPWLDYDPGAFNYVISREQYAKLMPPLVKALKHADPDIQCIGCIETPYVTLFQEGLEGADKLPRAEIGGPSLLLTEELTEEQASIIKRGMADLADSLILNAAGKPSFETYVRGMPQTVIDPAVRVFPRVGNGHFKFLKQQVKFLIDDVGLDGVYFDMFALGQIGSMRSYLPDKWDGISAEMDFNSGAIYGKYIDCSLVAIEPKVQLVNDLHARGKIVVANRHSTSREEQALAAFRFTETGWGLNKMTWQPGEKPPPINYPFFGVLSSPIGLGIANPAEGPDRPDWLMKGLITYLRHGQVYYHHTLREGPREGEGSREFGPMKHMFPITPVELGEGFIIAKERILTAVSMDRLWTKPSTPVVYLFDMNGRSVETDDRCTIKREGEQWRVALNLHDWAEVAVVE